VRDLSLNWEEINACDCLFAVTVKDTIYKKLYIGRFKGDSSAIIQLGKKGKKQLLPITKARSKTRKPGSAWQERYQNKAYTVTMEAKSTTPKVKGRYTYFVDFKITNLSSKKTIKNTVLTNCKS